MFNFSINPKMRDIRTGDHKDPRNRMNEYGNGKSRKICWTQNLYSQNIQRINHFRISIFTSKLAKFWQTKKNILGSFSIYFSLDFFSPRQGSTDEEWIKENLDPCVSLQTFQIFNCIRIWEFRTWSELWFWTWWRHRKVPEDIVMRIIELIGRNGSKRLKNDF